MTAPFIAIGFGLVVIASCFLTLIFFRAWRYPLVVVDARFKVVVTALMYGTGGVGLWALNPLQQALGGDPLNGWVMFAASLLVLISMASLIGSTAIGGARTMLAWFLATASAWCVGVLIWWYLL